ncbi:MAG: cell division protein FtsQ/DivIB [Actinomycetaceae bacterium]|nr:cell division protein FtsQ/DivIB [Actinomycetaceae bacterium]
MRPPSRPKAARGLPHKAPLPRGADLPVPQSENNSNDEPPSAPLTEPLPALDAEKFSPRLPKFSLPRIPKPSFPLLPKMRVRQKPPAAEQPKPSEPPTQAGVEPPDIAVDHGLERRLQERRIAARKRLITQSGIALGIALGLLLVGYIVFFSPLFALDTSEQCSVEGNQTMDPSQICAALAEYDGTPLTRLPEGSMVETLKTDVPAILRATITREWRHGIHIAVIERVPVAAALLNGKQVAVDVEGVPLERTGPQLAELPQLALEISEGGEVAVKIDAALSVLDKIPPDLLTHIASVEARSSSSIELKLKNGVLVRWGDTSDSELKADVMRLLISEDVKEIDVSTPRRPSTL